MVVRAARVDAATGVAAEVDAYPALLSEEVAEVEAASKFAKEPLTLDKA